MKNFAQALGKIINTPSPMLCSEVPHALSRTLLKKHVLVQEVESKKVFKAFVVDYCHEDHKGFIVSIAKAEVKGLIKKHQMIPAEYKPKDFVECDLRNIFSGSHFLFLGEDRD